MAMPGAVEDMPWPGDTAWKFKGKIFAMTSGESVTVKSTPDRQAVLIMHPAISKAAYVGRFGWVTIAITNQDTLGLALGLVEDSYDMVAFKIRLTKPKNKGLK